MVIVGQYGNDAWHGPSGTPSMRIAVTEKCDMNCRYCPTHGDSYRIQGGRLLDNEELARVSGLAHDAGFRAFSITGGEPLLVPDATFSIARNLRTYGSLGYLRLNTNGISLKRYSDQVAENFDMVKVSIDRLSTGAWDDHGIHGSPMALEGLDSMKERGVPCRVNMVVGNLNLDQVPPMIEYCQEEGIILKLLDMTLYKHTKSDDPYLWQREFVSLSSTIDGLRRLYGPPITRYSVGGYGNPMLVFKPDSESPIMVRSSEIEGRYHAICADCPDSMCQDGFCNLTLTPDGRLKACRPEGTPIMPILLDEDGMMLPDEQIRLAFSEAIRIFQTTTKRQRDLNDIVRSWKR